MSVQPTPTDEYKQANLVFEDIPGDHVTQSSDQLWPGKQVLVTEPAKERGDLYSLYVALCFGLTTAASAYDVQRFSYWLEDCQQTGNTVGNPIFALMEEAARTDNPHRFVAWANLVDWSTSTPGEFIKAVDLALSLELASLARELAQEGRSRFPEHKRLDQVARVLAPPTVQANPGMLPAEGLDLSMAWLREHVGQYRGSWVAVRGGCLVATADTLEELEVLISQAVDLESTIVTRVL